MLAFSVLGVAGSRFNPASNLLLILLLRVFSHL